MMAKNHPKRGNRCVFCNNWRYYIEFYELIGCDAVLKLFKYFHGDKIDCSIRLYRPEFIADLAKQTNDRRERAKIARAGGIP